MSPRNTLRGKRHQRARKVAYEARCYKRDGRRIKQYARLMKRMISFAGTFVNVVENLVSSIQKAGEVLGDLFSRMTYPDSLPSGNSENYRSQEDGLQKAE